MRGFANKFLAPLDATVKYPDIQPHE